MGIEQRRKQLMAKQPEWGDTPSPPHLSFASWSSQSGSEPREPSSDPPPPATARDSEEDVAALDASDALIIADPRTRTFRVSKPPAMLSCEAWTLDSLVAKSKNFYQVPRVQWSPDTSTAAQIEAFEAKRKGVPLVVEGLHNDPHWITDKFTPEWFSQHGAKGAIVCTSESERYSLSYCRDKRQERVRPNRQEHYVVRLHRTDPRDISLRDPRG